MTQGSGDRGLRPGSRDCGLGLRGKDLGFQVKGLDDGIKVPQGMGCRVWGLGLTSHSLSSTRRRMSATNQLDVSTSLPLSPWVV